MSRILVTGGSGFVGNALVRRLMTDGHEVFITGRSNEQPTKAACISYTFHDIDWNSISPIDVVFHQAAITNTTHKPDRDFYFVNVQCSKALFGDAVRHGVKTIVYASSCAVYGQSQEPLREEDANPSTPINAYGRSKILFDEWAIPWAKEQNILVVGLRYSNVYGMGECHKGKSASMIYQLMQQMLSGKPKLFKWGEQARDFVHIKDVINANLLATTAKTSSVVNVGSGKATTFNQIIELLNKALKTNHSPEYFDNPYIGNYQNYTVCDLNKSNSVMNYTLKINLEEGIEDYVKNVLSYSSSQHD